MDRRLDEWMDTNRGDKGKKGERVVDRTNRRLDGGRKYCRMNRIYEWIEVG